MAIVSFLISNWLWILTTIIVFIIIGIFCGFLRFFKTIFFILTLPFRAIYKILEKSITAIKAAKQNQKLIEEKNKKD